MSCIRAYFLSVDVVQTVFEASADWSQLARMHFRILLDKVRHEVLDRLLHNAGQEDDYGSLRAVSFGAASMRCYVCAHAGEITILISEVRFDGGGVDPDGGLDVQAFEDVARVSRAKISRNGRRLEYKQIFGDGPCFPDGFEMELMSSRFSPLAKSVMVSRDLPPLVSMSTATVGIKNKPASFEENSCFDQVDPDGCFGSAYRKDARRGPDNEAIPVSASFMFVFPDPSSLARSFHSSLGMDLGVNGSFLETVESSGGCGNVGEPESDFGRPCPHVLSHNGSGFFAFDLGVCSILWRCSYKT